MSHAPTLSPSILSVPIGRAVTFAMAAAAGIAVANIYYNQPMLGVIENAFPSSGAPALIPTATQLGYAFGLVLLVPLGDLLDRRRLIVAQFIALATVLIVSAMAPTAGLLVVASALLGAAATVAQQIVPFAASLATPEQRGRTVGTVMSGLLSGILLSRTLAGFVAAHFGWRQMFWLGVPMALVAAGLMLVVLPRKHPQADIGYGFALKSLFHLWRDEPVLRRATAAQAALFASFTAFWTILALHLQEPAFHMGPDIAGLFGIVGAVGVFAAPLAGRVADRHGPHWAISAGALLTVLAWLIFGLWNGLPGLVVGVIMLDLGVQGALVSHQHVVFALHPQARSRLNTIFMTGMFLGGAIGSAVATWAWHMGGWGAVTILGTVAALLAILVRMGAHSNSVR
ncbi:MFS transporter [Nguyenibacter sp. L1]|uniref:MFS transporter n=1 Tax=Nguyenibacter sp. L1 TaxID=3049350 RepID=UPI002B46E26C|nr:MFS transporter [Nguyenibacter sp. L1]WRH88019.1 MFS transporter [Nguyenibacter sp. L1]